MTMTSSGLVHCCDTAIVFHHSGEKKQTKKKKNTRADNSRGKLSSNLKKCSSGKFKRKLKAAGSTHYLILNICVVLLLFVDLKAKFQKENAC